MCIHTPSRVVCQYPSITRSGAGLTPGVSNQRSLAQPCSWQSEKDYHQASFSISPPEVLLDFNPGGLTEDTPAATGQRPSDRIILSFSQLSLWSRAYFFSFIPVRKWRLLIFWSAAGMWYSSLTTHLNSGHPVQINVWGRLLPPGYGMPEGISFFSVHWGFTLTKYTLTFEAK